MKYQKYKVARKAADLISDCYGHYSKQTSLSENDMHNLLDDLRNCARDSEFENNELQHARKIFVELWEACGANLNEESPLDNSRMTEMKGVILLWDKEAEGRDIEQKALNHEYEVTHPIAGRPGAIASDPVKCHACGKPLPEGSSECPSCSKLDTAVLTFK